MIGLLLLLVVALLAIHRYCRRRSLLLAALAWTLASAVLTAWLGLLPAALLAGLQESPAWPTIDWKPDSTIIVLGVGTERFERTDVDHIVPSIFGYGRIVWAAELYLACSQHTTGCRVLVSGGDIQGHGVTEAAAYSTEFERLGVPRPALMLEAKSRNTFEQAKTIVTMIDRSASHPVILVTSGIHIRRSQLYFAFFGLHPVPIASDFVKAQPFSLAEGDYNVLLTDVALHEYIGIARFHLYNALGLNHPPRPPTAPP